jgi:hypothetical protein
VIADLAEIAGAQRELPALVWLASDLHLGEGVEKRTGRFARTENFFGDEAFGRWLASIPDSPAEQMLILNGDVFDFLRVTSVPDDLTRWQERLASLGWDGQVRRPSRAERRFGLGTQDWKSVWKLERIADGHPAFLRALAAWLNRGHALVLVKGNHDLELAWPLVRRAIARLLVEQGAREDALARVRWCDDWFALGDLYVEHGHRLEALTHVDERTLRRDPTRLAEPVGSLANRYLVNQLEDLAPFLDNIKPIEGAVAHLLREHPLHTFVIGWRSLRFFAAALVDRRLRGLAKFLPILILFGMQTACLVVAALVLAGAFDVARTFGWIGLAAGIFFTWLAANVYPYVAGAIRDALTRAPRPSEPEDPIGAKLRANVAARAPSARLATVGHTHAEDIQLFAVSSSSSSSNEDVRYLNSGTWIPLWDEERLDLLEEVRRPVLRFVWSGTGYQASHLQWNDEKGVLEPSIILRRS